MRWRSPGQASELRVVLAEFVGQKLSRPVDIAVAETLMASFSRRHSVRRPLQGLYRRAFVVLLVVAVHRLAVLQTVRTSVALLLPLGFAAAAVRERQAAKRLAAVAWLHQLPPRVAPFAVLSAEFVAALVMVCLLLYAARR